MKLSVILAALTVGVFPCIVTAQAPAVPAPYQAVYSLDQNYLDTFNSVLTAQGTPAPYAGMQCGSLKTADSNAGPSLLNSNPTQQLNALKALGVSCVEVHVSFPLLYEPYMISQGQSMADFENYYSNLAAQVRAMGLKLMVESTVLFTSNVTSRAGWNTADFYATLDWNTYQQARAQTALTIAQTLQPDYFVVLEEPDTEAMNSGQANVNTPSGANALLSQILAVLQPERQAGMKIGAGAGTWLAGFQPFFQGFVTQPMDFVDMHIYPINNGFLPNALTVASMAGAAHMPVSMTEAWLHKELDSELAVLTPDQVSARDVFSFFAPLDQYFLETMRNMAAYIQATYGTPFLFMNPFASDYFFAYQTYDDSTSAMSASYLLNAESSLVSQANKNAQYSDTGMSFYAANVPVPDTIQPTVPGGLSAGSSNPTTATLSWNQSLDNIGVAGYHVLRDGVVVGTTALLVPGNPPTSLVFQDSGLSEATTYAYSIQAFDLAGNLSPLSPAASVRTADATPPTAPGNLSASAASAQKVVLSWSPAADNTGVNSYKIFSGSAPAALVQRAQIAGTATSYTDSAVSAGTTYYYGVEATDKWGNASAMSSLVAVTTPQPPAAPTGLSASTPSATKLVLSWSVPANGGLPLQYFLVFRGSSASNLVQVGTPTRNSYTDTSVTADSTFYYAVAAVDSGGDVSAMSAVLRVTLPALPPAPPNVVATATSTSKISLTWSKVNASLPITCYYVYRGTSASSLHQIASSAQTSFSDASLSPAAKYYYAVQAVDQGGDLSPLSATVSATTLALPSAPVNLAAVAVSKAQINLTWAAGPSGMALSSFQIFRGSSPSNLTLLKTAYASTTKSTDYPVTPGTTYYYGVKETDKGGNISPMSKVVAVTTPSH
ncbi:MAG TPA: fibronectin type III domain-containing protein [Bryobacteraceae bacterium]|nr:fibronectin type III domain-containing protein [Bryobacteraceae bacterium]